jgi:hypothetical protein
MARKSVGIAGILVIAVLSFAAGYWPEHQKYLDTVGDLRLADKRVSDVMGRQRIYHLENILLQALDHAAHNEYKEAQALAAEFMLEIRTDIARPDMTKFKPELLEILNKSDGIKGALDKKDQAARDMMRGVMQQLARMAGPPPTASDPPAVISISQAPQS